MFEFCSLGSGSSGNASIIRTGQNKILIDAGLSLKKIEESFAKIELRPEKVDLLLLTHAHSDHSRSILNFAKKYQKPVFMTRETYCILKDKEPEKISRTKIKFLKDHLQLDNLLIKICRLPHIGCRLDGTDDSGGSVGFIFHYTSINKEKYKFAHFTDLGEMPVPVINRIKNCDYYFLEANHDPGWQKASRRPYQIIERNLSEFGHLSNEQSGEILSKVISKEDGKRRTRGVMLAHISNECNSHILAVDTVKNILSANDINDLDIKIAPEKSLSEYVKIL